MNKNIIIATDAWEPQINGVARTLKQTSLCLSQMGHKVHVIQPELFKSIPCPFSSDVRLAYGITEKYLKGIIQKPCAVHISTEGPIGLATRNYCVKNKIPFTTAYHTMFPEYMKKYIGIPLCLTRSYLRWFHKPSQTIMATTPSMIKLIQNMKFKNKLKLWTRGVDVDLFYPRPKTLKFEKPVGIYVGRISAEKNIEEFLSLDLDIEKIIVGDGPKLNELKRKYPTVVFTGPLRGEQLSQMYCNADVFVFPSKSDTFGLVVLESIASGVPVACFPVEGPGEIIEQNSNIGKASWNLKEAIQYCLNLNSKQECLEFVKKYSWQSCTNQFFNNLVFT